MKKKKSSPLPKRRRINFCLEAPDAITVALTGTFNDWNPSSHPMKKDPGGNWQKTLVLPVGKYEYKFFIDGEWRPDPQNDQNCSNSYGTINSVIDLKPL